MSSAQLPRKPLNSTCDGFAYSVTEQAATKSNKQAVTNALIVLSLGNQNWIASPPTKSPEDQTAIPAGAFSAPGDKFVAEAIDGGKSGGYAVSA